MPSEKSGSYENAAKKASPFKTIFELQKRPVLVLNHKTLKVLDGNNSAVEFFKMTLSELKKKSLNALIYEGEQKAFKEQFNLFKGQDQFQLPIPFKNMKKGLTCPCEVVDTTASKVQTYVLMIDNENAENISLINTLKKNNLEANVHAKKMLDVNRKMVTSYENVKKQYEEILQYLDENIKSERKKTIGEMVEVFQDKVNKPLTRILDDIQKIQDADKNLDSAIIKRLKLIEESVENIMRIIGRIAEVQDIKKMRYIELSNI